MDNDLKLCPFCGASLEFFGHDLRNGEVVEVFIHPANMLTDESWDRCPLTRLVFDKKRWNRRPREDELEKEVIEARTDALDMIDHHRWEINFQGKILAALRKKLERMEKIRG